jgi:hypothetical protein
MNTDKQAVLSGLMRHKKRGCHCRAASFSAVLFLIIADSLCEPVKNFIDIR